MIISKAKWCLVFGYKPPKLPNGTFTKELTKLATLITNSYDNYVIIGDLNFNVLKSDRNDFNIMCPLDNLCIDFNLQNLIRTPTVYHKGGSSLIDVFLTNKPKCFCSSGALLNDLSDGHSVVYGILKVKCPKASPVDIEYRSFKNFKTDNFLSDLQGVPFQIATVFDDPYDSLWLFSELLTDVLNGHAPTKRKRIRNKQPAFMNTKFRKAVRAKHKLFRRLRTPASWEAYRKQRNICTDLRRKSVKRYFQERCTGGSSNETFWKTIRPFVSSKGSKNDLDLMVEDGDDIITDPIKVANSMNTHYANIANGIGMDQNPPDFFCLEASDFVDNSSSYYTDHPSILSIVNGSFKHDFSFNHVNLFTVDHVDKAIKNLDTSKATGCDGISAKVLTIARPIISVTLTSIFNQIVTTSIFPDQCKLADVRPIYKKADPLAKKNYRPVSILTTISKLFERLLEKQLLGFHNKIIHPKVSAFRPGHSCQLVLISLTEDIRSALDSGLKGGLVMMDLSKAFDCIPHHLFISKLAAYGMSRHSLILLASYLAS